MYLFIECSITLSAANFWRTIFFPQMFGGQNLAANSIFFGRFSANENSAVSLANGFG